MAFDLKTTFLFVVLLSLTQRSQAAILTVTTSENFLSDGVTLAPGSLRQALQTARDGDTVRFKIPGAGPHVIQTPFGGYPLITAHHLTIDGYSQPGSMPNTNPILGGNNAKIRIVLDASLDVGQSTPLPFSGYGDTESAILGIHEADYFTIRGISFLSRQTAEDSSDPSIYCLAFVKGATHAHVHGCWFGLAPDGVTVSGGRTAVAAFASQDPGGPFYSSHLVIGTDGNGSNDLEEFNVIEGMGLALALELPNAKISGNYINVLPDGNTFIDVGAVAVDTGTVEFLENGRAAHNTVVGTDGDGVSDENERNIIAPTVYDHLLEFYDIATNVVIAGNYFGVGVDGVTTYPHPPAIAPDFVALSDGSSVRIGSNGDGISDPLEANWIYNVAGGNYVDSGPSTTIVSRRNRMVNNNFAAILFPDGANGRSYPAYYSGALTGPTAGVQPVLLAAVDGRLSGTLPEPNTKKYPYSMVDVYVVDPDAWVNAWVHPGRLLGSFVEGSTQDLDPAPNQFVFDLKTFNLPADAQLAAAVTYSEWPGKTEAGHAVTGILSEPVAVDQARTGSAPPKPQLHIGRSANGMLLSWSAGPGVFRLEWSSSLKPVGWTPVVGTTLFTSGQNTIEIPLSSPSPVFYRLLYDN